MFRKVFLKVMIGANGVTNQEGYHLVEMISDGKVVLIAHERMYKCYEIHMVHAPSSPVKRMMGSNVSQLLTAERECHF